MVSSCTVPQKVNNMIYNIKQFSIQLLAVAFMGMMALSASAQAMPEPQALVKEASDNMLKALKEHEAELEQDPQKIFSLVQDILIPHFDFERMARLALGRSWRDASAEQQAKFVEEFRLLLVRTYATAMLEYTNEDRWKSYSRMARPFQWLYHFIKIKMMNGKFTTLKLKASVW